MSDLIYSTAYQPFADRYLHFPHNLMPSSVVLMQVVMNLVYTKSNGQTSVRQTDCIPVVFSSCFFSTRAYAPEPTLFLCFIFTRGIRLRYLTKLILNCSKFPSILFITILEKSKKLTKSFIVCEIK